MTTQPPLSMNEALSGQRIFGDDFDAEQIAAWYRDEEQGYSDLAASSNNLETYEYHAQNKLLGYRHLTEQRFAHVLGFGSGFGLELLPIIDRIDKVSLVDASPVYGQSRLPISDVKTYKADTLGKLPFADQSFDLITCFGVLHHIPNVSYVLSELARTLKPGAALLLREPTNSMGDWSKPRRGLTMRERGLPVPPLNQTLARIGLRTQVFSPCSFPLVPAVWKRLGSVCYNSPVAARADFALSHLLAWNYRYHRATLFNKVAPAGGFWVLRRAG